MKLEASQVIDRPVAVVFHFFADEHVRNHPRWDPHVELEQINNEPLGLGTVLRRRNTRYATPTEGTMEVVEFERDRVITTVIHDGPMEIRGRATFEALEGNKTRITIGGDMPGMEGMMDESVMRGQLQQSADKIKELIETET
ncbi:MAG: SRPBCC family protein [Chloroflexota bacterium]